MFAAFFWMINPWLHRAALNHSESLITHATAPRWYQLVDRLCTVSPEHPWLGLDPSGSPAWTSLVLSFQCYLFPILVGGLVYVVGSVSVGMLISDMGRGRVALAVRYLLKALLSLLKLMPTYLTIIMTAMFAIAIQAPSYLIDLKMIAIVYAVLQLPTLAELIMKHINQIKRLEFIDAEIMMGKRMTSIVGKHIVSPFVFPVSAQALGQYIMDLIYIELSLTFIVESIHLLDNWTAEGKSLGSLYFRSLQDGSAPWFRFEVIVLTVLLLLGLRLMVVRLQAVVDGEEA
jgi:ABC-type dipeptide/oligopeptide/nickel transport system permease subunit